MGASDRREAHGFRFEDAADFMPDAYAWQIISRPHFDKLDLTGAPITPIDDNHWIVEFGTVENFDDNTRATARSVLEAALIPDRPRSRRPGRTKTRHINRAVGA
jgi:hypothetical protein